jgi:hypothetical protein
MRLFLRLVLALSVIGSGPAYSFGDYPLASCAGNDGTIIDKTNINTDRAIMKGIITKADMQEYCERDPGAITQKFGGKLTVNQCIEQEYRKKRDIHLETTANCAAKTLSVRYNGRLDRSIRFPLSSDADTSCASGMPPLISQFVVLCPDAAKRLGID